MNRDAIFKFFLSFTMGVIAASLARYFSGSTAFSLLSGWDLFGLTYIIFSVVIFIRVPQDKIQERCSKEDIRSWLLFLLVVIACIASLVTVMFFFDSRKEWHMPHWFSSIIGVGGVAFSWLMVHTSFAFRYAHLFYGDDNKKFSKHARGLTFPDDDAPDYFDFAYFSFVIGMTFQVSDVVITSKGVRRLVLMHSIISFVFNTVIIALTISELVNFN
jgi:uncharacterized membrane protein